MPLFIKMPHQTTGSQRRENVEFVDILPTIADVLREDLPFPIDGFSMFDPDEDRIGKSIYSTVDAALRRFDSRSVDIEKTVARNLSVFGTGRTRKASTASVLIRHC